MKNIFEFFKAEYTPYNDKTAQRILAAEYGDPIFKRVLASFVSNKDFNNICLEKAKEISGSENPDSEIYDKVVRSFEKTVGKRAYGIYLKKHISEYTNTKERSRICHALGLIFPSVVLLTTVVLAITTNLVAFDVCAGICAGCLVWSMFIYMVRFMTMSHYFDYSYGSHGIWNKGSYSRFMSD